MLLLKRNLKTKVTFWGSECGCCTLQAWLNSQTWANDHLWIATTCPLRPLFWGFILDFNSIKVPLNNDHLSTTNTILGSLYTSNLTVYTKKCVKTFLKGKYYWTFGFSKKGYDDVTNNTMSILSWCQNDRPQCNVKFEKWAAKFSKFFGKEMF